MDSAPLTSLIVTEKAPTKDSPDYAAFRSLCLHIRESGVVEPVVVEKQEDGRFLVREGGLRALACQAHMLFDDSGEEIHIPSFDPVPIRTT